MAHLSNTKHYEHYDLFPLTHYVSEGDCLLVAGDPNNSSDTMQPIRSQLYRP